LLRFLLPDLTPIPDPAGASDPSGGGTIYPYRLVI
jgi:hypothetical protein